MVDPFYMLMYLNQIGKRYVVWDKSASIEFIRPGRGTVTAHFKLNPGQVEQAKAQAADGSPALITHQIEILDCRKRLVARSERTVYVRLKTQ